MINKLSIGFCKIIITTFLIICIYSFKCKAAYKYSDYNTYESTSSSGYAKVNDTVKYNQVFELYDIKVSFTQDSSNYKFSITAKSELNDVAKNIGKDMYTTTTGVNIFPFLYKTENFGEGLTIYESIQHPFADFSSGRVWDKGTVTINSKEISKCDFEWAYSTGTMYNDISYSNGDKYFIPKTARYYELAEYHTAANTYPCVCNNNGEGVLLTKNSSNFNVTYGINESTENEQIDYIKMNVDIAISINKNYIDDYRYICFGAPYMGIDYENYSDRTSKKRGYSLCTNTIDLKPYTNCSHTYTYSRITSNATSHKKRCSKCLLEETVPHSFIYEYDGIENDLCDCGYKKQINIISVLNSDEETTKNQIVNVNSSYEKNNTPFKTGYLFKHFKKNEKQIDGSYSKGNTPIKTIDIGIVSKMDDICGENSVSYEAVYEPIKYTIRYNKQNNKNIECSLSESIVNDAIYDKEYIQGVASAVGYIFKGWTKNSGSDIVDYGVNAKLKNLTSVNDAIIDLYPVFDNVKYIFSISTISNIKKEIRKDNRDLLFYYGSKYNLPSGDKIDGYTFKGWTLEKGSINVDFVENAEIYNYTNENEKKFTIYPVYEAHKYKFIISSISNINKTIENDINEMVFTYDENKYLPDNINIYGYYFKGWSLKKGANDIDFNPKALIYNYTSENNAIYTVYPVYDAVKYNVICSYNLGKNAYQINDIYIGRKVDLPKMKTLPKSSNSYGWFYNNIKVNTTLDIDKYVKSNGDTLTIEYKTDKNVYAYTEDEFNKSVSYTIKYIYPGSESKINNEKTYITKEAKVGINEVKMLYEFENMYRGSSNTGWYHNDKKVKNTSDILPFVKCDNDVITINYKFFKNLGGGTASTPEKTDDNNGPSKGINKKGTVENNNKEDSIEDNNTNDNNIKESNAISETDNLNQNVIAENASETESSKSIKEENNNRNVKKDSDDEDNENIEEDIEEVEDDENLVYGPINIFNDINLKILHGYAGPVKNMRKVFDKKSYEGTGQDISIYPTNKMLLNANIESLIKLFNENKFVGIVSIVLILILLIVYEYFTIKYYQSHK